MHRRFLSVLFAFPVALGATPARAQETHPFSVDDMLAMDRISDPQVSPDGQWIAYNVRVTDLEANKGRTDIWIASVDGTKTRRMTSNPASDFNARWMPDGKSLVFLSTRSGSSQVWRVAIDGGEAVQLSEFPLDVDNLVVFPDGQRLALTMEVHPKAESLEESKKLDDAKAKEKATGRVYERLLVRHWDTWEDGKRSHVFVWTIGAGAPIDLMKGMETDCPPKPFGGAEEISVHPDGSVVAFSAKKPSGSDEAWNTDIDVWSAPSDGSKPPEAHSVNNLGQDTSPCFSPDGKRLAYLAMGRPGYEADKQVISVFGWGVLEWKALTYKWDRSASEIAWSRDAKTIYTTADDVGHKALYAVDAETGNPTKLVAQGTNATPRDCGTRLVFAQDSLAGPVELYSCARDGKDVQRITHVNDAKVAAARFGAFEQFSFPGWNGETVYGWVVKPCDFAAGQKYPIAFLIHGGPQGSFGNHFHYRWNPQAYAGAGYAAVFIDFHGSTGYGQAFCDSIRGDWGGKPYEDLMKGLDFAIAKYPFLDGSRAAALGASFGGYMVNWIAGQTDRFKALVSHDGNLDERMAYFDTEELWFPEWDHGGTPWENAAGYTKHNPIDHVAKWKTPMLVIHGALDYRVVDTQGLSTFNALQRRGIPSKLLYFPDENHWVLKPANSKQWHQTVIAWIDQWTKPAQ
jgi:dipeptidyl aminopeptidase/acylaminoacyl peptidase